MSNGTAATETYKPVRLAAIELGLPMRWLQAEVVQGRIPGLRVGRRLFVDVQEVKSTLSRRADRESSQTAVSNV